MNTKHAQTPWHIGVKTFHHKCDIYDSSGALVAVAESELTPLAEAQANAAYIVRACNGYADAIRAVSNAENWLREYETGPDSGLHELLAKLRAVLAGNPLQADRC